MTVQINGSTGVTTPGLTTDTSVANTSSTLTGESVGRIKTYTDQATTSGTLTEFLSIPSWAKEITINITEFSTTGTNNPLIQLGSATYTVSGYVGSQSLLTSVVASGNLSTGFFLGGANASSIRNGIITLVLQTGNTWVATGNIGFSDSAGMSVMSGYVTLGGVLDRLRLYASGDTFDRGAVNIIVKG